MMCMDIYGKRVVHDADSYLIESHGWLESYASNYVSDSLDAGVFSLDLPQLNHYIEIANQRFADETLLPTWPAVWMQFNRATLNRITFIKEKIWAKKNRG